MYEFCPKNKRYFEKTVVGRPRKNTACPIGASGTGKRSFFTNCWRPLQPAF